MSTDSPDQPPPGWSIADARQRFSEVVRASAREPQALYNRGRIVGVVIDPDEYEEFRQWKRGRGRPSLADSFEELRAICQEEDVELIVPERIDRPDGFTGTGRARPR